MKPILFNTEMVQAILNGTKVQTRRIVKPKPPKSVTNITQYNNIEWLSTYPNGRAIKPFEFRINCPYGQIGDILWVRETHKFTGTTEDGEMGIIYKDGTQIFIDPSFEREDYWNEKLEKLMTTMEKKDKVIVDEINERYTWNTDDVPWTPSIFMPKDACRLFLKITNIKVERLYKISNEDIEKEGVDLSTMPGAHFTMWKRLWESINGKDSWNENPWLWVIEFERTENK